MNSSFATIGVSNPWPRSRPCSASEPGANLHPTLRSAVLRIFPLLRRGPTPSYWGLLKQPDKQKQLELAATQRSYHLEITAGASMPSAGGLGVRFFVPDREFLRNGSILLL